jgi:23S rRNA pseudouridine1911/1915/1917 synthase
MRDKDVDPDSFVRPHGVDPAAILTVVRVPREWERWRLDRVVHATFTRMSRTRAQDVVRIGAFAPDGRKLRNNDRVKFGDVVLLYRPPFEEPDVPLDCPVIFEDDVLLAIDKPAGLPVHPTARYHHNTVVSVLHKARPDDFLALCHRIDRETSGVLLLAKTPEAERFVKRALEVHVVGSLKANGKAHELGVAKRYLALTWGAPTPPAGRIALPLALDEGHRFRVKMRITPEGEPGSMPAATRYETLEIKHRGGDASSVYAKVACDLETGRQHQIRAHLAAIGAPIVGDKLYGGRGDETWDDLFGRGADGTLTDDDHARLELPRHALHAHRLVLPHPTPPHRPLEITSDLPVDLRVFFEKV